MIRTVCKVGAAALCLLAIALATFWFSRPQDLSFHEARASVPHAAYSKFVNVGGVRLHYQEKGLGEPLVLIHGYTSSTYTWKDVFIPLSEEYRVIAIDLKGFGFSDKPDGDYTRRSQGKLVAELLVKLNVEQAWIVGNSMGGESAINVALNHPEKVKGLILIDSAGVQHTGSVSLTPWYLKIPAVGRLLTALVLTSDALVREGLEKSYFNDAKITESTVAYYHAPLKTTSGQLAAIRAKIQSGAFPVEDKLGRIDVPVLLIWGENDEVIPIAAGQKMHSAIKSSSIRVLENCGHVPQEEEPERVIAEIKKFITKQLAAKE